METVQIMEANETDASVLAQIDAECFSVPVTEKQMLTFISNQNYLILKALEGNRICGYVCMSYVLDEGNIYNLCVLPEFREKGIALQLMTRIHSISRQMGIRSIALEVRVGNQPAIRLYEKTGYFRAGILKNHYTLPKEDAYIYIRNQEIE